MTETDIAYIAGIIDGEGHIRATWTVNGRKERHQYLQLIVRNTCKELIDYLHDNLGGHVHLYDMTLNPTPRKDIYHWILQGKKAKEILDRCKPYFKVKANQYEQALLKLAK